MSRKRVSLIIIGVLAVVVIGGALVYQFVIKPQAHQPPSAAALQSWQYAMSQITTNLQGSSVIQIQLTLQAPNGAVAAELTERQAQVEDAVIGVLHNLSSTQIMMPGGRELIKQQVMKRINSFLVSGKITEVYIDSLIVQ
ncbi:MAG: flagellar basal body-associated FliL family protein [Bacilli bacterium]